MTFSEGLLETLRDDAADDDDFWDGSDHEWPVEHFAIRAPCAPAPLRYVRKCFNFTEKGRSAGQSTEEVDERQAVQHLPASDDAGDMSGTTAARQRMDAMDLTASVQCAHYDIKQP